MISSLTKGIFGNLKKYKNMSENKMLKIAGKDSEGRARAFATNSEGALNTNISGITKTETSLDVYNRSVLEASQDSVSLGGNIASSLVRKPDDIKMVLVDRDFAPQESIALLNADSYIKIIGFEVNYIHSSRSAVQVFPRYKNKIGERYIVPRVYFNSSGMNRSDILVEYLLPEWGSETDSTLLSLSNFAKFRSADGEPLATKMFLTPNSVIECPCGAEWDLKNNTDDTVKIIGFIHYIEMPV